MHLPEELIARMLSYLQPDNFYETTCHIPRFGLNALHNASLVSKTFNRIAEPLLYERLIACSMDARRFTICLESLLSQPQRQQYVLAASIRKYSFSSAARGRPTDAQSAFSESFLEHLFEIITVSEELKEDIARGIESGSEDAKAAIFLCICLGLRHRHIEWSNCNIRESLVMRCTNECGTRVAITTEKMPLQRLQRVSMVGSDGRSRLSDCVTLLELPSLATFRVVRFWGDVPECGRFTSTVSTLDLVNMDNMQQHEFATLFHRFSSLRVLTLSFIGGNTSHPQARE